MTAEKKEGRIRNKLVNYITKFFGCGFVAAIL